MHRLFRIPEVVEHIVLAAAVPSPCYVSEESERQLQTFHLDEDARSDVVSLGLASKVFIEHVLNVMWHTQTSFKPLFRLMDNIELEEGNRLQDMLYGRRPSRALTHDDCTRMLPYSSRIKAFYPGEYERVRFTNKDVQTVQSWGRAVTPNRVLFPKLLAAYATWQATMDIVFILNGANNDLTDVKLAGTPGSLSVEIVETLRDKSESWSSLRLLDISEKSESDEVAQILTPILLRNRKIAELSLALPGLQELWQVTAELPVLRRLCVHHHRPNTSFLPREFVSFDSLIKLDLTMPDVASITFVLGRCTLPRIQVLKCAIWASSASTMQATQAQAVAFVDAMVAAACSGAQLSTVVLEIDCENNFKSLEEDFDTILDSNVLAPFFRYPSMRSFTVQTEWLWEFHDEFLQDLAEAWPEIEELYLDLRSVFSTTVSLHGLGPLAFHCPRLGSLACPIDGDLMPTVGTQAASFLTGNPHTWQGQRTLRDLQVGRSQLSRPRRAAAVLSRLFPLLGSVEATMSESEREDPDDYMPYLEWERVSRLLSGEPWGDLEYQD